MAIKLSISRLSRKMRSVFFGILSMALENAGQVLLFALSLTGVYVLTLSVISEVLPRSASLYMTTVLHERTAKLTNVRVIIDKHTAELTFIGTLHSQKPGRFSIIFPKNFSRNSRKSAGSQIKFSESFTKQDRRFFIFGFERGIHPISIKFHGVVFPQNAPEFSGHLNFDLDGRANELVVDIRGMEGINLIRSIPAPNEKGDHFISYKLKHHTKVDQQFAWNEIFLRGQNRFSSYNQVASVFIKGVIIGVLVSIFASILLKFVVFLERSEKYQTMLRRIREK